MKRVLTMIVLMSAVLFFSECKKEDECEQFSTGVLCFENFTSFEVILSVDNGIERTLQTNDQECYTLSSGLHSYFAYPTNNIGNWSSTEDVTVCEESTVRLIF